MKRLQPYTDAIHQLCQQHHVKSLYAFGSVLTDHFNKQSDIDLLVDFNDIDVAQYADNYFNLKFSLQEVLQRNIDLLEAVAIKNPLFRKTLDQQQQLIYGQ